MKVTAGDMADDAGRFGTVTYVGYNGDVWRLSYIGEVQLMKPRVSGVFQVPFL